MESSYLMAVVIRAATAIKRGVIDLAKIVILVISILSPMWIVVLPYCHYMAANMMPADTPDRLWATMGGILLAALLMFGIPAVAFWVYGRKLASRFWH